GDLALRLAEAADRHRPRRRAVHLDVAEAAADLNGDAVLRHDAVAVDPDLGGAAARDLAVVRPYQLLHRLVRQVAGIDGFAVLPGFLDFLEVLLEGGQFLVRQDDGAHPGNGHQDAQRVGNGAALAPPPLVSLLVNDLLALLEALQALGLTGQRLSLLVLDLDHAGQSAAGFFEGEGVTVCRRGLL